MKLQTKQIPSSGKSETGSPKVSQGRGVFGKSPDGALEGIRQNSGPVSERPSRASEAKTQARAAFKDGRLYELLQSIPNEHQKIVVSGWAFDLSDQVIRDMVKQAGGYYQSSFEWACRRVVHWSFPSAKWKTTRGSNFHVLLHEKAQAEDKSPETIIDGFPPFLQRLARRMVSHHQETIKEMADVLEMKSTSAAALVSTKLCWLVGGPRPKTYSNWSDEDLIELTLSRLAENKPIQARLRGELWYRKYCISKPVDIEKIARDRRKFGKRYPYQQKVYDAIQQETSAGKKLNDIVLYVREQLGDEAGTYVVNAMSPNPLEMPKLGIKLKLDKCSIKKLVNIIRGGVLRRKKRVTDGFREATTKLLSLQEPQKEEFIRTLHPFEFNLLINRGLKNPPDSFDDLVKSMETFRFPRCRHRQTVRRIERALAKKLRAFLDRISNP